MKKEKKKKEEHSALHDFIVYLIILVVVILIRTYLITPVIVSGSSMDTTLQDNEIMILNKINYRFNDIKRFDIVVIKEGKSYIIKRVIGLPNETISYKDDTLYINEKEQKEYFKNQKTKDFDEVKIDKDCYFVMGDNRKVSLDSRISGCIPRKQILGKANLVLFPLTKIGYKK